MTQTQEKIQKELSKLDGENADLFSLIQAAKGGPTIDFNMRYQDWYTRSLKIVDALAPDRLEEFVNCYRADRKRKTLDVTNFTIEDWIMGHASVDAFTRAPRFDRDSVMVARLLIQTQILTSLSTRIEGVLSDVRGHLFAELQDAELRVAGGLVDVNFRAAGALAGVILERHLQRVAVNHKLTITKKAPTISDLNEPLKQAGIYDVPTWRKIQLLGDIRNLCCHQKTAEPTKDQVNELIQGVNSVIKSVF